MVMDPAVSRTQTPWPTSARGCARPGRDLDFPFCEVARQLGVSASFVSQLENGKSQPSVATLYSLAQLLDVSIDELFAPARLTEEGGGHTDPTSPDPTVSVSVLPSRGSRVAASPAGPVLVSRSTLLACRRVAGRAGLRTAVGDGAGERPRLVMDTGVVWEQLASNTDHTLDFMEIVYPAGSSSTTDDRMLRHEGYEYGFLIEGELQVTFGFEVFMLRAGEALGLDSSVPHLFKNLGSVPARGIWFVHHRHA